MVGGIGREIQGALGKLIVKQYSEYEPLPGMHVNGELTQGENIADIGGVKIAYAALQKALDEKSRGAKQEDRRLHAGATILPRFRADLALRAA